jgi:DNA-binding XRE family transcriptional regulator
LVHVKEPRTDVLITGSDPERILAVLKQHFDVVLDDDELVSAEESEWFNGVQVTPGEALAIYRENADLTLDQLAERSSISKSHLSEMENGKRNIGRITAKKLAAALGCDYRSLL